jgi:hypothetical protein
MSSEAEVISREERRRYLSETAEDVLALRDAILSGEREDHLLELDRRAEYSVATLDHLKDRGMLPNHYDNSVSFLSEQYDGLTEQVRRMNIIPQTMVVRLL